MGPYFCLKCERANNRDAVISIVGDKYRCIDRQSCELRCAEIRRMRGDRDPTLDLIRLPVEDMSYTPKETPVSVRTIEVAPVEPMEAAAAQPPSMATIEVLPVATKTEPRSRVVAKPASKKRVAQRNPEARRPGPEPGARSIKSDIVERKVIDGKKVRVLACGHTVPESPGGKAHLATAALCYTCGNTGRGSSARMGYVA